MLSTTRTPKAGLTTAQSIYAFFRKTTRWTRDQRATSDLRIGYFGSSTGGAAALVAAAKHPRDISAGVSRGGRPDLAEDALAQVQAPNAAYCRRSR